MIVGGDFSFDFNASTKEVCMCFPSEKMREIVINKQRLGWKQLLLTLEKKEANTARVPQKMHVDVAELRSEILKKDAIIQRLQSELGKCSAQDSVHLRERLQALHVENEHLHEQLRKLEAHPQETIVEKVKKSGQLQRDCQEVVKELSAAKQKYKQLEEMNAHLVTAENGGDENKVLQQQKAHDILMDKSLQLQTEIAELEQQRQNLYAAMSQYSSMYDKKTQDEIAECRLENARLQKEMTEVSGKYKQLKSKVRARVDELSKGGANRDSGAVKDREKLIAKIETLRAKLVQASKVGCTFHDETIDMLEQQLDAVKIDRDAKKLSTEALEERVRLLQLELANQQFAVSLYTQFEACREATGNAYQCLLNTYKVSAPIQPISQNVSPAPVDVIEPIAVTIPQFPPLSQVVKRTNPNISSSTKTPAKAPLSDNKNVSSSAKPSRFRF